MNIKPRKSTESKTTTGRENAPPNLGQRDRAATPRGEGKNSVIDRTRQDSLQHARQPPTALNQPTANSVHQATGKPRSAKDKILDKDIDSLVNQIEVLAKIDTLISQLSRRNPRLSGSVNRATVNARANLQQAIAQLDDMIKEFDPEAISPRKT